MRAVEMTALYSTCGHEVKRTGYEVQYRDRDEFYGGRTMFHETICPRCLPVYKKKYKLLKIKKVKRDEKFF